MRSDQISNDSANGTSSRAGRWFLGFIGLCILLMGLLFFWLLLRSYQNALATRDWPQVQAVVLQSDIERRQVHGYPEEYRFVVLFSYVFEGESHLSNKLSPRGVKWVRNETQAEELVEQYASGTFHTAWINPNKHGEAILQHDTKAAGYTLWFPGLFVLAGAGILWSAMRRTSS